VSVSELDDETSVALVEGAHFLASQLCLPATANLAPPPGESHSQQLKPEELEQMSLLPQKRWTALGKVFRALCGIETRTIGLEDLDHAMATIGGADLDYLAATHWDSGLNQADFYTWAGSFFADFPDKDFYEIVGEMSLAASASISQQRLQAVSGVFQAHSPAGDTIDMETFRILMQLLDPDAELEDVADILGDESCVSQTTFLRWVRRRVTAFDDMDFVVWLKRAKALDVTNVVDRDRWHVLRETFLFFDGDDSGSIEVNEFEFFVVALDDEIGAGSSGAGNAELERLKLQLHDLQDEALDTLKAAEGNARDEETVLLHEEIEEQVVRCMEEEDVQEELREILSMLKEEDAVRPTIRMITSVIEDIRLMKLAEESRDVKIEFIGATGGRARMNRADFHYWCSLMFSDMPDDEFDPIVSELLLEAKLSVSTNITEARIKSFDDTFDAHAISGFLHVRQFGRLLGVLDPDLDVEDAARIIREYGGDASLNRKQFFRWISKFAAELCTPSHDGLHLHDQKMTEDELSKYMERLVSSERSLLEAERWAKLSHIFRYLDVDNSDLLEIDEVASFMIAVTFIKENPQEDVMTLTLMQQYDALRSNVEAVERIKDEFYRATDGRDGMTRSDLSHWGSKHLASNRLAGIGDQMFNHIVSRGVNFAKLVGYKEHWGRLMTADNALIRLDAVEVVFQANSSHGHMTVSGFTNVIQAMDPEATTEDAIRILTEVGASASESPIDLKLFLSFFLQKMSGWSMPLNTFDMHMKRLARAPTVAKTITRERWAKLRWAYIYFDIDDSEALELVDFQMLYRAFDPKVSHDTLEKEFEEATCGREGMLWSDFHHWCSKKFEGMSDAMLEESVTRLVVSGKSSYFGVDENRVELIDAVFDSYSVSGTLNVESLPKPLIGCFIDVNGQPQTALVPFNFLTGVDRKKWFRCMAALISTGIGILDESNFHATLKKILVLNMGAGTGPEVEELKALRKELKAAHEELARHGDSVNQCESKCAEIRRNNWRTPEHSEKADEMAQRLLIQQKDMLQHMEHAKQLEKQYVNANQFVHAERERLGQDCAKLDENILAMTRQREEHHLEVEEMMQKDAGDAAGNRALNEEIAALLKRDKGEERAIAVVQKKRKMLLTHFPHLDGRKHAVKELITSAKEMIRECMHDVFVTETEIKNIEGHGLCAEGILQRGDDLLAAAKTDLDAAAVRVASLENGIRELKHTMQMRLQSSFPDVLYEQRRLQLRDEEQRLVEEGITKLKELVEEIDSELDRRRRKLRTPNARLWPKSKKDEMKSRMDALAQHKVDTLKQIAEEVEAWTAKLKRITKQSKLFRKEQERQENLIWGDGLKKERAAAEREERECEQRKRDSEQEARRAEVKEAEEAAALAAEEAAEMDLEEALRREAAAAAMVKQRQREAEMELNQEFSDMVFDMCDSAKKGEINHKAIMAVCFKGVPIPSKSLEAYEATVGANGTMNRDQFFMWAMAMFASSEAQEDDDDETPFDETQFYLAIVKIIEAPKDAATLAAEARARRVQNGEVAAKRTTEFLFGAKPPPPKAEAADDAQQEEEGEEAEAASDEDGDHENETNAAQVLARCFNGIIQDYMQGMLDIWRADTRALAYEGHVELLFLAAEDLSHELEEGDMADEEFMLSRIAIAEQLQTLNNQMEIMQINLLNTAKQLKAERQRKKKDLELLDEAVKAAALNFQKVLGEVARLNHQIDGTRLRLVFNCDPGSYTRDWRTNEVKMGLKFRCNRAERPDAHKLPDGGIGAFVAEVTAEESVHIPSKNGRTVTTGMVIEEVNDVYVLTKPYFEIMNMIRGKQVTILFVEERIKLVEDLCGPLLPGEDGE